MDRVLIAGIESAVGTNFAASLANRTDIRGLSFSGPVQLSFCETSACRPMDLDAIRATFASFQPTNVIFCGPGSRSIWDGKLSKGEADSLPEIAKIWGTIARDFSCPLTWISSDAVFSGPWIFHGEGSPGLCPSPEAAALRSAETSILRFCPNALVVRTHAFGWVAASTGPGWIERLLARLENGTAGPFDSHSHATPILASDLVEIVVQAIQANLAGIFHIAGGERTNAVQFAERLADVFEFSGPRTSPPQSLHERPAGFGRGESSLRTTKIRHALGVSMPLLSDGLARLRMQKTSGYCDLLSHAKRPLREKVA